MENVDETISEKGYQLKTYKTYHQYYATSFGI